jgi:hypothetical protein
MKNNVINLTVSLLDEDRARIEALTAALQNLGPHLAEPQNAPQAQEAEPVKETTPTTEKPQENASQAEPEPIPDITPLPDIGDGSEVPAPQIEAMGTPVSEPFYTREDVRCKVVALCATGKRPEVKEIVNAYAESVTLLPEDKLDEVMGKLNALEG